MKRKERDSFSVLVPNMVTNSLIILFVHLVVFFQAFSSELWLLELLMILKQCSSWLLFRIFPTHVEKWL